MAAATHPVAIKIDADIKERAKRLARLAIAQCTGSCVKQSPSMSSARKSARPSVRTQSRLGKSTGSQDRMPPAEEADAWLAKKARMPSPRMPRVIWSLPALQDVQRLHRFLAGKNADAARRAVKATRESVKVLAHQPGIGFWPRIWSWSIESGSPISGP